MTNSISTVDRLSRRYPSRRVRLSSLEKNPDSVANTSIAYDEMWARWELIEDLCLGRDQMILKERQWLPQEPKEKYQAYLVRLDRSFLFGFFNDTLERLVSKPFAQEVIVKNVSRVPDTLRSMFKDVDRQGTSLTPWCKRALRFGYKYGHALALVDYPAVPPGLTLAQQLEMDIRPYWILISPSNFIGWKTRVVNGTEVPVEIRYREVRIEPKGLYGDQQVEYIRIVRGPTVDPEISRNIADLPDELRFGTIEEWRAKEDETGQYDLVSRRFHTYPGVPIAWLPINPTGDGLYLSTPPLQELAEQNLAHWQSYSDMRNILRFVAVAMLLLTGIDDDASEEETGGADEIAWGPNQVIQAGKDADGKYIEHSGKGITSLRDEIKDIEQRGELLGMQPMLARNVDVTATAVRKDDVKVTSNLQSSVRALEQFLAELLRISATWVGETFPIDVADDETSVSFDVFSDFGLKVATRDDARLILEAWAKGSLDDETFLKEWQKRAIIGDDVNIRTVMEKLKEKRAEMQAIANSVAGARQGATGSVADGDEDREQDGRERRDRERSATAQGTSATEQ